jgi:hypothetical protein
MRIHLCTRDGSGGAGAVALGCVSVLVSFELAMFPTCSRRRQVTLQDCKLALITSRLG